MYPNMMYTERMSILVFIWLLFHFHCSSRGSFQIFSHKHFSREHFVFLPTVLHGVAKLSLFVFAGSHGGIYQGEAKLMSSEKERLSL